MQGKGLKTQVMSAVKTWVLILPKDRAYQLTTNLLHLFGALFSFQTAV